MLGMWVSLVMLFGVFLVRVMSVVLVKMMYVGMLVVEEIVEC